MSNRPLALTTTRVRHTLPRRGPIINVLPKIRAVPSADGREAQDAQKAFINETLGNLFLGEAGPLEIRVP